MKATAPMKRPPGSVRRNQQGAVLYVALIMLILLALIGVVGMQVSGMQERMSANYQAVNLAFENAEGLAREIECSLEGRPGCDQVFTVDFNCWAPFDTGAWAAGQGLATSPAYNIRRIDECTGTSRLEEGGPVSDIDAVYQITAYASDANPPLRSATSASVIETIYKH